MDFDFNLITQEGGSFCHFTNDIFEWIDNIFREDGHPINKYLRTTIKTMSNNDVFVKILSIKGHVHIYLNHNTNMEMFLSTNSTITEYTKALFAYVINQMLIKPQTVELFDPIHTITQCNITKQSISVYITTPQLLHHDVGLQQRYADSMFEIFGDENLSVIKTIAETQLSHKMEFHKNWGKTFAELAWTKPDNNNTDKSSDSSDDNTVLCEPIKSSIDEKSIPNKLLSLVVNYVDSDIISHNEKYHKSVHDNGDIVLYVKENDTTKVPLHERYSVRIVTLPISTESTLSFYLNNRKDNNKNGVDFTNELHASYMEFVCGSTDPIADSLEFMERLKEYRIEIPEDIDVLESMAEHGVEWTIHKKECKVEQRFRIANVRGVRFFSKEMNYDKILSLLSKDIMDRNSSSLISRAEVVGCKDGVITTAWSSSNNGYNGYYYHSNYRVNMLIRYSMVNNMEFTPWEACEMLQRSLNKKNIWIFVGDMKYIVDCDGVLLYMIEFNTNDVPERLMHKIYTTDLFSKHTHMPI